MATETLTNEQLAEIQARHDATSELNADGVWIPSCDYGAPGIRESIAHRAALLAHVATVTRERDEAVTSRKVTRVMHDELADTISSLLERAQKAERECERLRAIIEAVAQEYDEQAEGHRTGHGIWTDQVDYHTRRAERLRAELGTVALTSPGPEVGLPEGWVWWQRHGDGYGLDDPTGVERAVCWPSNDPKRPFYWRTFASEGFCATMDEAHKAALAALRAVLALDGNGEGKNV